MRNRLVQPLGLDHLTLFRQGLAHLAKEILENSLNNSWN